jgi:hypothetical protein
MDINLDGVLALPFESDDLNETVTIREYLKRLLLTLWDEGEGFSGKRPFGNSGWEWDMAKPLIKFGIIEGSFDSDGYIENFDRTTYNKIIREAIASL